MALNPIFMRPMQPAMVQEPSVTLPDAVHVDSPARTIHSYFDDDPEMSECCVPEFMCRECMIKADTNAFYEKETCS